MARFARLAVSLGALIAVSAPTAGRAMPTLRITAPDAGACLGGGGAPVAAQAGVDPPFLPADVDLTIEVAGTLGEPIALVVRVDGAGVLETVHVPTVDGVSETVSLTVPALAVADGVDRTFRVEAENAEGAAAEEVVATIDRRPPRVIFPEGVLAGAGACAEAPPADPAFEVEDAIDADPSFVARWETVGCERRFEVTVADHCGDAPNRSVVTYRLKRPPPAPPTVRFETPAEGEIALRAVVDYTVTTGEGCLETSVATLARDGGDTSALFDGDLVITPGAYTATVTVDPVCVDAPVSAQRRFTVVGGPVADAGGPYRARQGEVVTLDARRSSSPPAAGLITSYDWDLDNDGFYDLFDAGPTVPFVREADGQYPVWLRITTATGERAFDDAVVTVADPEPSCDAGGPYVVEQGAPLVFDGTSTAPGGADEPILSYAWDFGDDRFPQQGDGLVQPVHRYEREGEYTVTLTAFDIDSSCVATARVSVRDIAPVIRNLHVLRDGVPEGEPVEVSAGQTSAGSAAEPLLGFTWTFGDGSPPVTGPEVRAVSHVYPDDGAYEVCLSVRDADSTVSECVTATVTDLAPRAVLVGPGFALEGESVSFDATGSRAGGAADALTALVFEFGDGSPTVERAPAETRVDHVFTQSGEVTVRVTVADEDSTAEAVRRVIVEDAVPQAALDAPRFGPEGVPLTFDAGASVAGAASDPIVAWHWDFGDGTSEEGPALETVTHVFPDDGLYLVTVAVEDADGSVSRRDALVRIDNVAPTGARIEPTGAGVAEVGRPWGLRLRADDVDADPLRVTWTFGDGARLEGPTEVTHTWGAPGRFRVAATVDDGDGGTASAEAFVQVERPGPEIEGPAAGQATEGVPYEADFDVRPAPVSAGVFDAPVTVRVLGAPAGADVDVVDLGGGLGEPVRQRVRFRFTPGYAHEGRHRVTVEARSASGLVRRHEHQVSVLDAGTPILVGAAGTRGFGEVSLFQWARDPASGSTAFARRARTTLGEVPGPLVLGPQGRFGFVSLPASGTIGVLDLVSGALVRRIPLGADARAAVFLVANGGLYVLGPGSRLHRIDEETLKLDRSRVLEAPEPLTALARVGPADAGVLIALGAGGRTLYRWPDAVLDGVRPSPPMTVDLGARTAGVRGLWANADGSVVLTAETKRAGLLRLDGAALAFPRPALEASAVGLSGMVHTLEVTPEVVWATTTAGLEQLPAGAAASTLVSSRAWRGLAVLPAALLGETLLGLGTSNIVEVQRPADSAILETYIGNGAATLRAGLRRRAD